MSLIHFSEDLKRETWRYLHKKYYDVIMDELQLMTRFVKYWIDNPFAFYTKITADKGYIMFPEYTFFVVRWNMYHISSGKSIQRIKSELKGH